MPDHSLEVVAISGIGTVSTAFCLMLQALSLALAMLVMSNSTAGTLVLAATGKHSAIVCECGISVPWTKTFCHFVTPSLFSGLSSLCQSNLFRVFK